MGRVTFDEETGVLGESSEDLDTDEVGGGVEGGAEGAGKDRAVLEAGLLRMTNSSSEPSSSLLCAVVVCTGVGGREGADAEREEGAEEVVTEWCTPEKVNSGKEADS